MNSAVSIRKVSKERKGKLNLEQMGENHETCEDTGKQHGGIPRYMGSDMYEKCGSELERPYLSPKGKDEVYKLGEVTIMTGGSRRGT